ncbi:MAG: hypothetical protein SGPRY_013448, partial [Prymnesium sp.]
MRRESSWDVPRPSPICARHRSRSQGTLQPRLAPLSAFKLRCDEILIDACAKADIGAVSLALMQRRPYQMGGLNRISLSGRTPLVAAVQSGGIDVVKRLLAEGADANFADGSGLLALHVALAQDNAKMKELLLAAGARQECIHPEGTIPRLMAKESEMVDVILNSRAHRNQSSAEVLLHIYLLGRKSSKHRWLGAFGSLTSVLSCRLCGLYHTAVEVAPLGNGMEWSYDVDKHGSSLYSEFAREDPRHSYYTT